MPLHREERKTRENGLEKLRLFSLQFMPNWRLISVFLYMKCAKPAVSA